MSTVEKQALDRPKRILILSYAQASTASNAANFAPIYGAGQLTSTEANADLILDCSVVVKKIRVAVQTNTKSNNWTVALRDDGASVGTITVTANNGAEEYTSSPEAVILTGSKVNFSIDTSASGSGNAAYTIIAYCEVL